MRLKNVKLSNQGLMNNKLFYTRNEENHRRIGYTFIVITISILISVSLTSQSYSHSLAIHVEDFKHVLEGLEGNNISELYKIISSEIIDTPPPGVRILGNHRFFGHWGFEGNIPFRKEPYKSMLDKLPPDERPKYVNAIKKAWQERVKRLITETELLTGLEERQAKAFAGLIYNTHLLGDWVPGNKVIDPLMDIDSIKRDIIKNLHRLHGNNAAFVKKIEIDINKISKRLSKPEYAAAILGVLKKYNIGENIYALYGNRLLQNGIRYEEPMEKVLAGLSKSLVSSLNKSSRQIDANARSYSGAKAAVRAGVFAAVISGLGHGWEVYQGQEDARTAMNSVIKDSALATTSYYIADGIIQNIGGGKYAITALIEKNASLTAKALGTSVNYGVATFIFDETQHVYYFCKGDLTEKEFISQTEKSILKAAATGTGCYCAVLMGATAGGPVVMAVSISTYIAVDIAISKYDEIDDKNYFFIEDVLGKLPLSMQNKSTAFKYVDGDYKSKNTPFVIIDDNRKLKNSRHRGLQGKQESKSTPYDRLDGTANDKRTPFD